MICLNVTKIIYDVSKITYDVTLLQTDNKDNLKTRETGDGGIYVEVPSSPHTSYPHTLVPCTPHTLIPLIPSYPSYPRTPRTLVPV